MAVLFAREGADISIVYLPEEEDDAKETKQLVEKERRECQLIPGNLMDNDTCKSAVQKHIEKFVSLLICSQNTVNDFRGRFGQINVLVNNASKQILCDNFDEIDLNNVESTFRSNILQMFAITKYALPHMKKGSS